jgi:hypothetical protein
VSKQSEVEIAVDGEFTVPLETLTPKSRLNFPRPVFVFFLALLATIFPQAYGLVFAREGVIIGSSHFSPAVFVSKLELNLNQFYLIGFIPTFITILFLIMAIFYRKIHSLKYITIICFGVVQFLASLGYTRIGFSNATHAIYHSQSYKINAMDIGIIFGIGVGMLVLLIAIILLIVRRKFNALLFLHQKPFYLCGFLILGLIVTWVIILSPVLLGLSGAPTVGIV